MRQALAKQLVYFSLLVASCVMQPWIQFARPVVVYLEQNRGLTLRGQVQILLSTLLLLRPRSTRDT